MNWISNIIRPKIRSFVNQQKEIPDNLWQKCPACDGMLFHRDLVNNLNVCYHCGHHMRISVVQRLELLFDGGQYKTLKLPEVPADPLKFKDRKRYSDRMKEAQQKTGRDDAIIVAEGTVEGNKVVVAAFDFSFMGGSMGAAVGEGIVTAAHRAVSDKAALIVIPSSGGARMQEGIISLMQMPRTIIGVNMVKEAGLPYIVILTDPTTGGVSASFAMVGDVHIAEPGSMIGFAGKRVIEETIREKLPEGFQTAEYLLEHGMVDMVVSRKEMKETVGRIIDIMMNKVKKGGYSPDPEHGKRNKGSHSHHGKKSKHLGHAAEKAGTVASLDEKRHEKEALSKKINSEKIVVSEEVEKKVAASK